MYQQGTEKNKRELDGGGGGWKNIPDIETRGKTRPKLFIVGSSSFLAL
jgi:hypothetical protein